MAKRLPSLDFIAEIVHEERSTQNEHFQSLDTKASVILGFSSALVALGGGGERTLTVAGQFAAVMAALLALWSFLPRRYPVLDLKPLRDAYITAEQRFTKLHLLDTEIEMVREASYLLGSKALRLKGSMAALFAAAVLVAGAIIRA